MKAEKELRFGVVGVGGMGTYRVKTLIKPEFNVKIVAVSDINPAALDNIEKVMGTKDFKHYTDIMEFLSELNRQGITVIMVTHDMHLMLEYTPHAIVIAGGRKIGDDSAVAILTDADMAEKANLKLTSLYELAQKAELPDPQNFVQQFIDYEEARRRES